MSRRVNLADMLDGEPLDEPTQAAPRPPVADVAQIAPNPENPRGAIDTGDQDFVELVTSIGGVGVITPLTVCSSAAFLKHHPQHAEAVAGRQYVVVAGHRRLEAARQAGLTEVPAFVNDDAAEDPLVFAVAENLLRVGLSPIQEAEALRVLTDKPPAGRGMSQSKVAKGIGKTQAFVSQRIALLELVPELQQKVAAGELGIKAARAFTALPAAEQVAAYEESLAPAVSAPQPVPAPGMAPDPAGIDTSAAAGTHNPVMDPPSRPAPTSTAAPTATTPTASAAVAEPVRRTAVEAAESPAVPEQRAPQGAVSVPDVDWHDIAAFVAAIRKVLDKTEVYQLAEALVDSLRD